MPLPIHSISGIAIPHPASVSAPRSSDAAGEFRSMLESAVGQVEQLRSEADQAAARFVGGDSEELHTTVLAAQRAELGFELFLQVRNKVVQAYQEVMRMQL